MKVRTWSLGLALVGMAGLAGASQGLALPAAETLWPQWQARITLMSAGSGALALAPLSDSGAAPRGLSGVAVMGDYVFAQPAFGSFRASGGLLSGSTGGLPLASGALASQRLGVSVLRGSAPGWGGGAGAAATLPYIGLGFSGAAGLAGLSLTADLGLVAERPEAAAGLGRALFGNQGMERSLRELRLAPVMQLGVRYAF
ncbi:MAG: hypothetical protein C0505_17775 [Leptothrix sp. (in: Bacteria)]|nr:hypothetical protein [Leptothrix sp. (in: b-proteobacteria)]